ncbi:MAG: DUF364 domain-containing protein [Pseudomonadales bacterium]|nr:DUF364 domain-containing protein [Pseudomonadales bacterium]
MLGSGGSDRLYAWLISCARQDAIVDRLLLGLNWTVAETPLGIGLAFSPVDIPRTLNWPGTLAGKKVSEVLTWLRGNQPAESAVALAVLNAVLDTEWSREARAMTHKDTPHLVVFQHFREQVRGSSVAVVGHYPGLERYWHDIPYVCIERRPRPGDLPESEAVRILPRSDWVFITASSLANGSLPFLLQMSAHAQVVLMGPSLPWVEGWQDWGVNYLAGVRVRDAGALWQTVAEGGGTRIFHTGVDYLLLRI